MEIQFIEYKNAYGRSHNGTTCNNFLDRSQVTSCTNIFQIRIFTKSFSRAIITQAFEEKADKTVKFMQILNSKTKNPWKVEVQRRLEVYFFTQLAIVNFSKFKMSNKTFLQFPADQGTFTEEILIGKLSKERSVGELHIDSFAIKVPQARDSEQTPSTPSTFKPQTGSKQVQQ